MVIRQEGGEKNRVGTLPYKSYDRDPLRQVRKQIPPPSQGAHRLATDQRVPQSKVHKMRWDIQLTRTTHVQNSTAGDMV